MYKRDVETGNSAMLFCAAEDAGRAEMPQSVCRAFMSAMMAALQKQDGGVHGNRNKFPKIDREDFGQTVWEDS